MVSHKVSVCLLAVGCLVRAAPPGFPSSGNGLWYDSIGTFWARHFLPLGNGYLAAMTPGGTTQEVTFLNIESLWSGGPFQDPTYNGGNMQPDQQSEMESDMQSIRQTIFTSQSGTIDSIDELMTDPGAYGSFATAGYLISTMENKSSSFSDYSRFLDLDKGIAKAIWTQDGESFSRETFCSHPAQACVQNTTTSSPSGLSQMYALATVTGLPTANVTCSDNSTLRLTGFAGDPGMMYEILASVVVSPGGSVTCSPVATNNATIVVQNVTSASVIWVGGTNYDASAGDAAHDFSFQGPDPHDALQKLLSSVLPNTYSSLISEHAKDIETTLYADFSLDLGQKPDLDTPTDQLKDAYETDIGNKYLEWLLFNYGRYLLAGSARGDLPTNLQGKWSRDASAPWGADYHANINLQMFYWAAEVTNMDVTQSLWDYIEKTWAPRGAYTAQVLYNITRGWVTHNEMNIFGHTGMKPGAQWADYPEANAWMMVHVWDHFDFTNDIAWWKTQGYPLLKGVASFHLDKLIPDEHYNDGTLVVAPCNSPEQPPITLGCAHAQQLIWQLFNAVEKGAKAAGEDDQAFLDEIKEKRAQMDKGIHIGSWGQLQEWKVDMDSPTDTHRHLSHLVGLYPGYAVSNFNSSVQNVNYTSEEVLSAAETSLIHRGNGTGPDADSGWEKVWRAACWAQFANSSEFYHELSYSIERNFGENLFSLYDPFDADPIFQIDANLGYPAALMNALIQAPDVASSEMPITITVLPALPEAWPAGAVNGARLRGGISVDMAWEDGRPTKVVLSFDKHTAPRPIRVVYANKQMDSFMSNSGSTRIITSF